MGRNMMIGQSGGPTVAINASLSGAIKRAMKNPEIDKIYGVFHGIEGILDNNFVDLTARFQSMEDFERLESTPAMVLGSCRYKLPQPPHPVYERLLNTFRKYDIGYFFYIGGNDSMDTILKLSEHFQDIGEDIRCVGIPKTIDNDLPGTDHTPGFGSAARYIATAVAEISCDNSIYDIPSISVVEVMGRNAGWLTAASALARRPGCSAPHLIYLPEIPFSPENFIIQLKRIFKHEKHVVIAVSEGIRFADGSYVSTAGEKTDAFGHHILAGAGKYLEYLIQENINSKVRSIELNVLQRAASHQHSNVDIKEACRIGAEAVTLAVSGKSGTMAAFKRVSNNPYLINYESVDIRKVANREKKVPLEWIAPGGCDIREEMIDYLRPLTVEKDGTGIPAFFTLINESDVSCKMECV